MNVGCAVSTTQLIRQLRDLGVAAGDVLLVHTSFRALRPVQGGPEGLIAALRKAVAPGGTVVMPSWAGTSDEPFDPRCSMSAADLGIVAQLFWRLPGVERSDHEHAFAAVGPHAGYILQDDLPLPPHRPESPVGRVHDLDGKVALLGVNHDADTSIHLAEVMAGVPYGLTKHCTVLRDGAPQRIEYRENDHCCRRFLLMDDWLRQEGLQREGRVGHGTARLARARAVVAAALRRLREDPFVFLHAPGSGCADCDAARAGVEDKRT